MLILLTTLTNLYKRNTSMITFWRVYCELIRTAAPKFAHGGEGGGVFSKSGQNLGKNRPQKYQVSKNFPSYRFAFKIFTRSLPYVVIQMA